METNIINISFDCNKTHSMQTYYLKHKIKYILTHRCKSTPIEYGFQNIGCCKHTVNKTKQIEKCCEVTAVNGSAYYHMAVTVSRRLHRLKKRT